MNIAECIEFLFPEALETDYLVQDDGDGQYIKKWNINAPIPTEKEFEKAWEDLTKQKEDNKYKEDRKKEYPPLIEQLEALWGDTEKVEEMRDKIKAIWGKYPKSKNKK